MGPSLETRQQRHGQTPTTQANKWRDKAATGPDPRSFVASMFGPLIRQRNPVAVAVCKLLSCTKHGSSEVWDVLSSQAAVDFVRQQLGDPKSPEQREKVFVCY